MACLLSDLLVYGQNMLIIATACIIPLHLLAIASIQ